MSALKGLTFAAFTRTDRLSPEVQRRIKLATHLREQMEMACAMASGDIYTVKKRKWVETPEGGKSVVEVNKRLKPWWQAQANGTVLLTIRYGARPLEFEKGKAAIIVKGTDEMIALLPKLIAATEAGEFDGLIAAAVKHRSSPKRKAA